MSAEISLFATPEERAWEDSCQQAMARDMDGRCYSYGQHVEWGWGTFLVERVRDHECGGAEEVPDYETFRSCPSEEAARATAMALNLDKGVGSR